MPIIPQTLNINNLRTTSAVSMKLHIIRKLTEYSLKSVGVKAMFTLTIFEILLFEGRGYYHPPSRGTGSKRFSVSIKNQKSIKIFVEII